MSINTDYSNMNNYAAYNKVAANAKTETEDTSNAEIIAGVETEEEAKDTVTISDEAKSYKPSGPDVNKALQMESDRKASQIRTLVDSLVGQANAWKKAAKGGKLKDLMSNLQVDEATKLQAQKDISEDGYWGVNATAQRLFDFAAAYAGDDIDKFEEMRTAGNKGYKEAERAWGGSLPPISQQTFDKFNDMIDARIAEIQAASGAVAADTE